MNLIRYDTNQRIEYCILQTDSPKSKLFLVILISNETIKSCKRLIITQKAYLKRKTRNFS